MIGVKDIDYIILNELGDSDLGNICLVNRAMRELCNTEQFWERRSLVKYGNIVKELRRNTWKDLYRSLPMNVEYLEKRAKANKEGIQITFSYFNVSYGGISVSIVFDEKREELWIMITVGHKLSINLWLQKHKWVHLRDENRHIYVHQAHTLERLGSLLQELQKRKIYIKNITDISPPQN